MSKPETVAFFVENRNGVRISGKLVQALPEGVRPLFVTADTEGLVGTWVSDESGRSSQGTRLPVTNLFEGLRSVEASNLKGELVTRMGAWLEANDVSRVVLFNDQSRRGRWVSEAAGDRPTILIQDGSLEFNFRVIAPGVKDQNWYYGTSGVSRVCVWGERNREQVIDRVPEGQAAPDVRITGSVMHSADPELAEVFTHKETIRRRGSNGAPLSILLFDQPLGAQNKADSDAHYNALRGLARTLGRTDRLAIKPHPSSDPALLNELSGLPGVKVLSADKPVAPDALRKYDMALTWFSTAFLDTMKAGVPLVFMSFDFINVVMPEIKSELVRTTRTEEELVEVVTEFRDVGRFRANRAGVIPDALIRINAEVVDEVVGAIMTAERLVPAPVVVVQPQAGRVVTGSSEPHAGRMAERALAALSADVGRPLKVAILGERFIQRIGVSLPAMEFARHLAASGRGQARLLDLMEFSSADQVLRALEPDEVVVINSLRIFWIRPWMSQLVRELASRGRTAFVYVHETREVIEREHATYRKAHEQMIDALKGAVVLCVSEAQRRMFKEWRIAAAYTVFNTTPGLVRGISRETQATEGRRIRVVMVGSVQQRKGVDLFSQVAELAEAQGLPFDFEWVGGGNGDPELFRSERVIWSGHLSRTDTMRALDAADVFLLSSSDDPMPLSAVEAVSRGLRTVTYAGVGTHEVLDGVPGYEAFELYEPQAALDAIVRVLEVVPDAARYDEVVELFSAASFSDRMIKVLSTGAPAHTISHDMVSPGAGAQRADIEKELANERYKAARVMSRSYLRGNADTESYRQLAQIWLKAGFEPEAEALIRTGHLLSADQGAFAAVTAVSLKDAGLDPVKINRWSVSNLTRRGWQRLRTRLRG